MSSPIRWLIVILLLACLALASGIVTCVNSETGGWAILLLLCALPLALAALPHAGGRVLLVTIAITLALTALHFMVTRSAQWQLSITVERGEETITLLENHRYTTPTDDPSRIPFSSINDVWAILDADDTPCTVSWWNGSDHLEVKAPLKDFFKERSMAGIGEVLPIITLLLLTFILLVTWARVFVDQLPPIVDLPRSRAGFALTFLIGVIVASAISPPSTWLSNEFLSRPDDWLCYETGARSMLKGNFFLMPPPGGVELWSLLYTPTIALLHLLLGPATSPLYIVQFGLHLMLVPLALRLVRSEVTWYKTLVIIGALHFVAIDINLHYAWHLLSDTLPLLLLMGLFVAIQRRRDVRLIALLCGLLYLVRLEFIGIGALVFVFFLFDRTRATRSDRLEFAAIYLLCLLPYFLRWFLLYGNLRPFPIGMGDTGHMHMNVMLTTQHMYLKVRALFGDYEAINPDLRIRYHWFVLHALFVGAIGYAAIKRSLHRTLFFALACFAYVLATRLFSPSVGIYGHRHSLALVLLEGIFIILVMDRSVSRTKTG